MASTSLANLEPIREIIELLETKEVAYHLGGSMASSVHGIPRQTHDLDLVADLPATAAAWLEPGLREL